MSGRTADVAIVGGGIIGLGVAFELLSAGAGRVVVLDHGGLGGEASVAAAGFIPVGSRRSRGGRRATLTEASRALLPRFVDSIRERSGTRVGLERCAAVEVAAGAGELAALADRVRHCHDRGWKAELVDRTELRRLIPGIAPTFIAGAVFPQELALHPMHLLACLRSAVRRLGGRVETGVRVSAVSDGDARGVLLSTAEGEWSAASAVVAAGWWSVALLAPLGVRLAVRPARGEMIALPAACRWPGVLAHGRSTLYPKGRGVVWVGSTVEYEAGAQPTATNRDRLLKGSVSLLPSLEGAAVLHHWAGIRPCSALGRPIVDRVPGAENIVVACGHHRDGFGLAPVTGAIAASLILRHDPPVPAEIVAWRRRR